MIRRDDSPPDGPARWLLISQIEHARISAELARHWGNPPWEPVEPYEIVLPTIRRHDDGWKSWEACPAVDRDGKPVAFTEMPTEESNEIWQRSIEGVADLGPLAQYLVASHFVDRRRKSTHSSTEATAFLTEFDGRLAAWLADWQRQDPPRNTVELATRALRYLQFFDVLSLWFCCQPLPDEQTGKTPDGVLTRALEYLQLFDAFALWFSCPPLPSEQTWKTPDGVEITSTLMARDRVRISPWSLTLPNLEIKVAARAVPRRPYASAEDLAAVESENVVIHWHLSPDP